MQAQVRSGSARGNEGSLAPVGALLYNRIVTVAPWELLERLDAAALNASNIHDDLCSQFDERVAQPCSCGVPGLLRDLAQWVSAQAVDAAVSEAQRAA